MENRKQCLLAEEKELEEKLGHVLQQLDSLGSQGPAFKEEMTFLRSEEAVTAMQLFEEENTAAKSFLEEVTLRHSELQQKCQQMRECAGSYCNTEGNQSTKSDKPANE
ncbi:synaptonemal complex central element protein 1-like [Ambystoma mexicanum]|uniref:synaptonemal complex central element protein 1-like n=1 Tax=Ambystoma mexicanum TaxID=8296 RepID=UPI0037E92700